MQPIPPAVELNRVCPFSLQMAPTLQGTCRLTSFKLRISINIGYSDLKNIWHRGEPGIHTSKGIWVFVRTPLGHQTQELWRVMCVTIVKPA